MGAGYLSIEEHSTITARLQGNGATFHIPPLYLVVLVLADRVASLGLDSLYVHVLLGLGY